MSQSSFAYAELVTRSAYRTIPISAVLVLLSKESVLFLLFLGLLR